MPSKGRYDLTHVGKRSNFFELKQEIKIEGEVLRLWFVGGGTQTTKSVRVPDASITLTVDDPAGGTIIDDTGIDAAVALEPAVEETPAGEPRAAEERTATS